MSDSQDYVIKHTSQIIYATLPGGKKAFLKYVVEDNVMKLLQTYTPEEYRGKGIASQLVNYAIKLAQANNWRIEPVCSYTINYFMKNRELRVILTEKYRDLSEEEWRRLLEEALAQEHKGR